MAWIKKSSILLMLTGVLLVFNSCKISLGLAPITSIDYSKVKQDLQSYLDSIR